MIKKIGDADANESKFYQHKAEEEEKRAWERMRENSKHFFHLARKKVRIKTPIGPFVTKEGKLMEESEAETLNKEYQSVFEEPDPNDCLPPNYFDSEEDLPTAGERLENSRFTISTVRKIVMGMSSESPGPSGICPLLIKRTFNTIRGYIMLLFRKILDERKIPPINRRSLIAPFLKSDKSTDSPRSYPPVALTEV